jgi:DNA-binding response OmpR family regulator
MIAPRRGIVLIVDDSEACAETLQIALESCAGVEVHVAYTAPAALRLLHSVSGPVAAVISDLQLPGMSGMDFLSRLRSESRFAQVPVLIISGDTDPLAPQDALSRGASAYFTKPYSPSEIRRKLEQLLK